LLHPSWPDTGYFGPQKELGHTAFNTHQPSPLSFHPFNLHGEMTITFFVLNISNPATSTNFFQLNSYVSPGPTLDISGNKRNLAAPI
jgi:hypothetical protein